MEITERTRRGRPRKFSVNRETAAFPAADAPTRPDAPLSEDAAVKEKVKAAAAAIPEIFTPEQVEWVFDAYVGILCFAYSIILKIDFMALWDELKLDDELKKQLSKPLAKICSRYAPAKWAGHTPEIELLTMMGIWTVSSFKRARLVQVAIEEKRRDAERTQPVQSPRRDIHVPA